MSQDIKFGKLVPFGEGMPECTTPETVTVEGRTFTWDPIEMCYPGLYIEPADSDGTLTQDSYYEIEEI